MYTYLIVALAFMAGSAAAAETCSLKADVSDTHSAYQSNASATGGVFLHRPRGGIKGLDEGVGALAKRYRNDNTIAYLIHQSVGLAPLTFPVESDMRELAIRISAHGNVGASVRDAQGNNVTAQSHGAIIHALPSACLLVIRQPAAGVWTLSLKGQGTADIRVFGDGDIDPIIEWQKEVGGYEGRMMTNVEPELGDTRHDPDVMAHFKKWRQQHHALAGKEESLQISVYKENQVLNVEHFDVATPRGKLLFSIPVKPCKGSVASEVDNKTAACRTGEGEYLIPRITVPVMDSDIYVRGTDGKGMAFQRMAKLFSP